MLDVGTRKFPRFESNIMMEFRPINKTNRYIVGWMRNCSSVGLSFKSENYNVEPKEDLEFKLKHYLDDLFVSVQGKAVWTEKTESGCVTGIELKEMDKTTRKKMLEIVSATGNIPDDSFNYDKDEESVVTERVDIESKKESVAFSSFGISKVKVKFNEVSNSDEFELMGKFVLCGDNNCIDPITDDVTVKVGTSSIVIPSPNSFVEKTVGKFKFKGTINGADVKMEIEELDFNTFNFIIKAKGIDLTGICNSVDVKLIIGNDEGQSNIRLKGMLKFEDKEKTESISGNKKKKK